MCDTVLELIQINKHRSGTAVWVDGSLEQLACPEVHFTSLQAAVSATLRSGGITKRKTMLGFGHQTVFGLCLALVGLAAVSVVCVALLFVERQDTDLLQQNITGLRKENAELRLQLGDYRSGLATQQETAARLPD